MATQKGESIHAHSLIFSSGSTSGTYSDWIVGSTTATDNDLTQQMVIQNNSDDTQTMTVAVQTYSGGYNTIFEKDYAILQSNSELLAEFQDQVLAGDASNPDKIVAKYDTAVTGSEKIELLASTVRFGELE